MARVALLLLLVFVALCGPAAGSHGALRARLSTEESEDLQAQRELPVESLQLNGDDYEYTDDQESGATDDYGGQVPKAEVKPKTQASVNLDAICNYKGSRFSNLTHYQGVANPNGIDKENIGKSCVMLGRQGVCLPPAECLKKNGGKGYTPVIGGCGTPKHEMFNSLEKFGSRTAQCCTEQTDVCVHSTNKAMAKPKVANGKRIFTFMAEGDAGKEVKDNNYVAPPAECDNAVKAGQALYTCDTAWGGGTCVKKEDCVGEDFISVFDLVSGPYLFFGNAGLLGGLKVGDAGVGAFAWAGRQSGYSCDAWSTWSDLIKAYVTGKGPSIAAAAAAKNYMDHYEQHKPVDGRELGLISWLKDKVVKPIVDNFNKAKDFVVSKILDPWLTSVAAKFFSWATPGIVEKVRSLSKYTCCVKPTCSTTCNTPSTSALPKNKQPKCMPALKRAEGSGDRIAIPAPPGTGWEVGYCPSSITAAQLKKAKSSSMEATSTWFEAITAAGGESQMQCAVPIDGPLTKTVNFFHGIPANSINSWIDSGAGTARPMLAADLDATKLGILTHANIPVLQQAQMKTVSDLSIKSSDSLNGQRSQFSGLLGKTGFKDKYTFLGLNALAALAVTDALSPFTASAIVGASGKASKAVQDKAQTETVVVTVTHEFQDDAAGSLALAIRQDLDSTRADTYAVQAEIQLLFSKYAYEMVSAAIKTKAGVKIPDESLLDADNHNMHVAKSIMNSISFSTLDYFAVDTPKDAHGRMLGAPKGKGVSVTYNVAVSVNGVKLATGGKMAKSNQVAACLNGQYRNPTSADASLSAQATAIKQNGVANTNRKPVKSTSALVSALSSLGGRRLDGSEELEEEFVRELAAGRRFPMQKSGLSASFKVITA